MPNKLSQLNCWMLSCSTNVWGVLVILSLQHFIMIRKYKGPKCNNTTEKPVWKLVFYSTSYTYQPLLSVPFSYFYQLLLLLLYQSAKCPPYGKSLKVNLLLPSNDYMPRPTATLPKPHNGYSSVTGGQHSFTCSVIFLIPLTTTAPSTLNA